MPKNKLDACDLHKLFISALDGGVASVSDLESKPLLADLCLPLPMRIRLYMFNITHPPGGRTPGEHKIQLIVPGQERGQTGQFDQSNGRLVVLAGYSEDSDVFVLWDAGLYPEFSYSRNVQVNPETVYAAASGRLVTQDRRLRGQGIEKVIAAPPQKLKDALQLRAQLTIARLVGGDE